MSILKDHKRFKDIVKGRIKENFKQYVTHGEMVGKQENDFIKISVPSIDLPRFKFGSAQEGGVGQGEGEPGQEVGQEGQGQPGKGEAGSGEGQHGLEVNVSLDELADILGEKLELPRIEPRGKKNLETENVKYTGLAPIGSRNLVHFKSSFKEALKRQMATGEYNPEDPIIVPIKRDLRFRAPKTTSKPAANAVVIYMMDVSGSMGEEQKEIVRLESFWINTWLKKNYKGLETRFIIHDAGAKEVDEKTFFSTSESGGTLISSAYKLCKQIIDEDYPAGEWNIYPFHFSDGDNWSGDDTKICLQMIHEYFLPRVNMFGYGQVESKYGSGQFLRDLEQVFNQDDRIVLSQIQDKDKILDSIKDFLGKGR